MGAEEHAILAIPDQAGLVKAICIFGRKHETKTASSVSPQLDILQGKSRNQFLDQKEIYPLSIIKTVSCNPTGQCWLTHCLAFSAEKHAMCAMNSSGIMMVFVKQSRHAGVKR